MSIHVLNLNEIQKIIHQFKFSCAGDAIERKEGALVTRSFPQIELLWQSLAVPMTNRIDIAALLTNPATNIRYRDGVSSELLVLNAHHYSLFLNLVECHRCVDSKRYHILEDFFFHLGCACDLAEEFLFSYYCLVCECREELPQMMTSLTRSEFIKIAEKWYDKQYSKYYENYQRKGKAMPIYIPARQEVAAHLFSDSKVWSSYKIIAKKVRTYRNIVAHRSFIGRIVTNDMKIWIPRIEKVQNYQDWNSVFAAGKDNATMLSDLQERHELMASVLKNLETALNDLWTRIVACHNEMMFESKNAILLRKYAIST